MEKKHSFFMKDKQNSDKIESLVDAFLSWTLQCCDTSKVERYNNSILHEYSKRITSVLLFGNPDELNKYEILSIETWRQWKSIDLCTEIFLKNKETQKDELARYKTTFEGHYNGKDFKLEYAYFSCKDNLNDLEKEECLKAGYRAYTMDQVFDLANPNKDWDYTGNAIFDEFWFTTW